MSTVLVVTPILVANWPVISAAVSAAVASMGYTVVQAARDQAMLNEVCREELEVEDSEILAGHGDSGQIVVEKDGLQVTFRRDARGALRVCLEGRGYAKQQLKEIGDELVGRVAQQFAYHRIVTELKARNMAIVEEEMTQDQSVRIRVRSW